MMMVGKHVFVVLLVLYLKPAASAFNSSTIIRCIEKEREALLLFKQCLMDEYERLSSWGSTEDCCKWSGIMCSNMTSHVIMLDLSNANLRGKISPSLLELQHLNNLDLSSNDFNGTIPHQLGNLTKLQHLDLSTANYGSITVNGNLEWTSHLSSLTFLDMSGINLSKAIDWLQAINMLPSLSELNLFRCELSNVVPWPSSLSFVNSTTSLAILDLSYNHLEGSLPDMKRFSALWQLDLSQNRLTGFSNKNFGLPSALFVLYLEDNQMGGLLPDLTNMSSLTDLYLANNQLNGTLPESMGQLSKLEYLDVSNNFLEGNISEPHFSNLSKLKLLDLSFNSLSFDLSSHWVPPFQLDEIKLRGCKLGPHFPKWLRTQTYFSYIEISNSKISDSIPNWFWDLSTRLYHLNLSSNQISGKLPNLLCLSTLDLSSNHLDGLIPLFSSNLTSLNLSNNRFSGPISSLCAITGGALTFIDLSRNLLAGGLPDCWMQFERLVVLNLENNNLFGKIPISIRSLDLIETLHLGNNSFFGELPSSLKNCTLLNLLDLGENKFSEKSLHGLGKVFHY